MNVYRVTEFSPKLLEAFERLLPQLSATAEMPTQEYISEMLKNCNTHLFIAEYDGTIVGMLSLVVVDIPTGRKAWIEDVVVDESVRGEHIGRTMVKRAIAEAEQSGVKKLCLTSNPSRTVAHALYLKCGFELYDTNLFRLNLQAE